MHKTFLSYHHKNEQDLKEELIEKHGGESFIDKSVSDGDIEETNAEETIMRTIREDYLADSTVVVVLVGEKTALRKYVNSEIQAALWNKPTGLIAVVRNEIYDKIFSESTCSNNSCNCGIKLRRITSFYDDYMPYLVGANHRYANEAHTPHFEDNMVYCSVVKYSVFLNNPGKYIDAAFDKREKIEPSVKRNKEGVPVIGSN
ncbi:TPA: TIR domain-containing protein [Raoultella ornithinolytica]|uniref:TIR domain-containing protein n=1 Tax=Raoultella ornithinolytica TaxID=54291 RepID=UPI0027402BF9|nr:TIR domain-containing protein [Raoultella ornithinolytica]WLP46287.1 TIR domain-containing protein [Raoultella ornithinolytica]HEC2553943.1 TIR domain-containing protein [Raoultella ornithinolytica]HEC2606748.1 TIR domain-containing protein [Raoultella ornithinolytica]HEC2611328.1 TIR domain-containing protein [Raoultella ornithinolytica]